MTSRKTRILLTISLAVVFIFVRLFYAFVFSGLDGKTLILDLPQVRLPGPFRHITLFGEVSIEGIVRNLQLALPFAFSIIVFGTLASFVSEKLLLNLANRLPLAKKLITAIAIGLSSVSEVSDSARSVGFARRLRKEKKFATLVPILERVFSRAAAAGLRLSRSSPAETIRADLRIKDLVVDDLGPFSAVFQKGSIHVITGRTGSGKSSLLQSIAGQSGEHFGRSVSGQIKLGDADLMSFAQASSLVSLVSQFPRNEMVADQLEQGLSQLHLSQGQSYELAVETELRRNPSVLLLDEPAAALDQEKLQRLLAKCQEFANDNRIVVIAEHRISSFTGIGAIYWRIDEGRLLPGMAFAHPIPSHRQHQIFGKENLVQIRLDGSSEGNCRQGKIEVDLNQGSLIAITGPNGSGKTTLLRNLATSQSCVMVHGAKFIGPDPTKVALVPDEVSDFFVTASLEEELNRADKIAKVPKGFTKATFQSLVQVESGSFERHPLDLSVGTQLALATAMQLSYKPQLLLLDEPVQGLDSFARSQLAETLRCVQETGCAVLFATHDLYFARSVAERVLEIRQGEVVTHKLGMA